VVYCVFYIYSKEERYGPQSEFLLAFDLPNASKHNPINYSVSLQLISQLRFTNSIAIDITAEQSSNSSFKAY